NRKTNISTGKRTYQPENEHINRKTNISTGKRKQSAEESTQSDNFIKKGLILSLYYFIMMKC
ncbi:hypothetical protein SAMN05216232_0086, partial [Virgibacillus subterraneus]